MLPSAKGLSFTFMLKVIENKRNIEESLTKTNKFEFEIYIFPEKRK